MAIDSFQKRMSATNHSAPWRGPLVVASEAGFSVGNRQAALYMYSGIASGVVVAVTKRILRYFRNGRLYTRNS